MSKKIKSKKGKGKKQGTSRREYELHSRSTFLVFEPVGTALAIELRRPRESRTIDVLNAIPRFNEMQRVLAQWIKEPGETPPESILIPGHEIEAMAAYMVANTMSVEGLAGDVTWNDLDDEERLDFWETLPNRGLMRGFGQLRGAVLADKNPQLLKELEKAHEAQHGR